jgi:hypothetical protein
MRDKEVPDLLVPMVLLVLQVGESTDTLESGIQDRDMVLAMVLSAEVSHMQAMGVTVRAR